MTSFLAGGGDGYDFLKGEILEQTVAGIKFILLSRTTIYFDFFVG